jgi:hypothetical protein
MNCAAGNPPAFSLISAAPAAATHERSEAGRGFTRYAGWVVQATSWRLCTLGGMPGGYPLSPDDAPVDNQKLARR